MARYKDLELLQRLEINHEKLLSECSDPLLGTGTDHHNLV
jgi:hypothetical protein